MAVSSNEMEAPLVETWPMAVYRGEREKESSNEKEEEGASHFNIRC